MALYTIGDLHLSLGGSKPMDIFGDKWANHVERLRESFSHLTADDVTVLAGDLSWGISLEESLPDFQFIDALPGRKIILKGNHDYWWGTATKMKKFFEAHGIESIDILFNNCFFYGDYALCGTRGWFKDEETGTEHDAKVLRREVGRLETSLKCAGEREKLVFLHYPPLYLHYTCPEILHVLSKYGVHECCYGHIHGYAAARSSVRAMASGTALFPQIFLILFRISSDNPLQFAF